VLPQNWEFKQQLMVQTYCPTFPGIEFYFELPETIAAHELQRTAFYAYTKWCMDMIDKHPHTEGPIMARRLLGWNTPSDGSKELLPTYSFVDSRFFATLDPATASLYSWTLRGRKWKAPNTEEVMRPDVKDPPTSAKTTVKSKKHLSKVKCYSHAKPCSAIKDLATYHQSAVNKGHPVKALHTGTCGVCNLYRDCGNKHGRLPASIYRAVVMAHLGPSNNLSQLCHRITSRHRHHDPPDPPLPSKTYNRVPRIATDTIQSSPQVAPFPRIVDVKRRVEEARLFRIIDGVYTFVGTDDDMVALSRQDLSGTFNHRPKKRVRND
jgi:hypothetical protein